jgi:hypothetical protein
MNLKVGRGDSNFLWFDNWHIDELLYQKHGHRVVYDTGSKLMLSCVV